MAAGLLCCGWYGVCMCSEPGGRRRALGVLGGAEVMGWGWRRSVEGGVGGRPRGETVKKSQDVLLGHPAWLRLGRGPTLSAPLTTWGA